MSQDEIAVMDGSKCIMQLRGVRPFFSDKFDITKHKQYPLLSDYDKKNEFDIEKYVKNRSRLRFKRDDVVDEMRCRRNHSLTSGHCDQKLFYN